MNDNSNQALLDYERKTTRPWWLRPAAMWSGASLLFAVGCLPLSVAITKLADKWLRLWLPIVESQRYAEWAGFALAAMISLAGYVAAILAGRAIRRGPAPRLASYACRAGFWINVGSLALITYIVFVLGGKW